MSLKFQYYQEHKLERELCLEREKCLDRESELEHFKWMLLDFCVRTLESLLGDKWVIDHYADIIKELDNSSLKKVGQVSFENI